jgi:hypothetical protein
LLFTLFLVCLLSIDALAQRYEVHPYVGGFFPGGNNVTGDFRKEGIYGAKAGVFVTPSLEFGGHFGYINHFEPTTENAIARNASQLGYRLNSIRGVLWEADSSYNLLTLPLMGVGFTPYLTLGAGALTTFVNGANSMLLVGGQQVARDGSSNFAPRNIVVEDGDTFFTFSYGGGFKALQLWGPMGLRADIRGRTIPNLYSNGMSWPEASGGLTFTWGER